MNIEKELFPNSGILTETKDGVFEATIIDVELDPLELTIIDDDDAIKIITSDYEYVYLSEHNLLEMIELLNEVKTNKNK